MTNSSPKPRRASNARLAGYEKKKCLTTIPSDIAGAATLIITVILFVLSTLIVLFAANYSIMQSKSESNYTRYQQAFEAAEAGLEFGINYLKENHATIIASPSSGFITPYSDSSITNITLLNNSKFTVVYTNPVANNYDLIRITSTGSSDDNLASRTITQDVQHGSLIINPPDNPLVSKNSVSLSGSAEVINLENNATITSALAVIISGSAKTVLSTGTSSSAGSTGSDISENNAAISGQTEEDFFSTYFGATASQLQPHFEHYFNNSSDTNYSASLNGLTGTSIWIDQTGGTSAIINGNTTIGSATNPVLLIINGNLDLSGNVAINGLVFVNGTNSLSAITGNVDIVGTMITTGALSMTGSVSVNYSSSTIDNLQNQTSVGYFAKVPGSWKDFN